MHPDPRKPLRGQPGIDLDIEEVGNSLIVTLVSLALVLIAGAMAAWALGEYRFKGNMIVALYMAIGIMVPTFVVSAFSMNVAIPMQGSPHAFIIVMGLAAVSVVGLLAIWRWKRM